MRQHRKVFLLALLIALFLIPAAGKQVRAEQEGDWTFSVSDNTASITGYTGSAAEIEIPATVSGYAVTSIGGYAFDGNITVTSVVIPESVTKIGAGAFRNCSSLTSVTLPSRLEMIDNEAFAYSKVKSITIPDSVTTIGAYAFRGCTGLRTLALGAGINTWLTDWGENHAFDGCTLLSTVEIPEGVTSIGAYAFANCTLLLEVTLPESVTAVGDGAFDGCELLDTATVYGSIGNYAFRNNTSMKNLTIVNADKIGDNAFENNTALQNVTFPATLNSIGANAFVNCTKLKSIEIPDSVTFVGAYAFRYCTQLESVVLGAGIQEWGTDWDDSAAFQGCTKLAEVTIKEGVTYLPNYVFQGCTLLKEISIPATVTSIGTYAFQGDTDIETVTMTVGLQKIDEYAFQDCTSLKKADLPASLLSIGRSAFENTQVREAIIPDKVMFVGAYAYANCPALEKVYLGESIEEWGTDWGDNAAFVNDARLEEVEIADGVLSLGAVTFKNTGIRSVDIPITVTAIGYNCFEGCHQLENVNIQRGSIEPCAFLNCDSLSTLTLSRITSIGGSAFEGCKALTAVEIPDTVTTIGNFAFRGCVSLSDILIPESVTELGAYSFADCTGLLTATIGNNITTWGSDWGDNAVFANCTSLQYAVLEDGANSLGNLIFNGCSSLIAVQIPDSVVSMGGSVFQNTPESLKVYAGGDKVKKLIEETNQISPEIGSLTMPEYAGYTVTTSVEGEGILTPAGEVMKPEGSTQYFQVVPARGYMLESFTVNGQNWYENSYLLEKISAGAELHAVFVPDPAYVEEYPPLEGEEMPEETAPAEESQPAPEGESEAAPTETESAAEPMEGESESLAETVPAEETPAEPVPAEGEAPSGLIRYTSEDDGYGMTQMYLSGVLGGASPSFLSDDSTLPMGALLNLMYRVEGAPAVEAGELADLVPAGNWYSDACVWAAQQGLVTAGELSQIDPEAIITRGEVALLVYRYAAYKGFEVGPANADLSAYPDGDEPAGLVTEDNLDLATIFAWAMENGMDYGTDGTTLSIWEDALAGQVSRLMASFLTGSLQ